MIYYGLYLILMNIATFVLYYVDKRRSEQNLYRISEKTLLVMSILGGAVGGYLAMVIFRHKTRHWYFNVINIVFIIVHIVLFVWISSLILY